MREKQQSALSLKTKKTQIHLQINVPNVKDLLKHHED